MVRLNKDILLFVYKGKREEKEKSDQESRGARLNLKGKREMKRNRIKEEKEKLNQS